MTETSCPECGRVHEPGAHSCHESSFIGILPGGLQVLRKLSETPVGWVYEGEYLESKVNVNVLFLRPEGSGRGPAIESPDLAELREQFSRAISIRHPNVASVRQMGETAEGVTYVVFEVFQGELLSQVLEDRRVLPLNEAVDLILQAAAGLQAVHDAGLYHGNLSPNTILVTPTSDDRPLVKLIRFGLVQHGAEPRALGYQSTDYAAPEALAEHRPDKQSDVFSLGAVLYRVLAGVPPGNWLGDREPIPEAARPVLSKALDPLPRRRFQTAAAFATALRRATGRSGTQRPGLAQRTLVAGAIAAGLAALAISGLWLLQGGDWLGLGKASDRAAETATTARVQESPSSRPAPLDTSPTLAPLASDTGAPPLSRLPRRRVTPRQPLLSPAERPAVVPESTVSESGELKVEGPESLALRVLDSAPELPPRLAEPSQVAAVPLVVPPAGRPPVKSALESKATGRESAEAEARTAASRVIATYAKALESNDLRSLQWIYPELSERERAAWKKFFSVARDVAITLNIDQFALLGSEAQLDVKGTFQYWNRSLHRLERSPVSFLATVKRGPEGWRLTSIH